MNGIPDVMSTLQVAISTDDDNQSERLIADYEAADDATKKIMDDMLICICGYSMLSLVTLAHDNGSFLDED